MYAKLVSSEPCHQRVQPIEEALFQRPDALTIQQDAQLAIRIAYDSPLV
jgi:hypothetical protein